ncbi:uncharacterized protein J4E88_004404 [Alternaria novae-zelandiae]|uniref:uncharacterized protein n=1 Tax=Alternaria novae-zelandiae TaxID=430562 RepID=UPI0020C3FBFF|nr:uncharacterized protein J4E88_004404 [Alternaria novae-zelandiae]KAI4684962.1 hypothetical protein J4E88_004404 [Alternaria novae-zelandiae]
MPTYFARGVSVRLGAIPLGDTTTAKIILRKGEAAKQQSALAEKRLLRSKLLKEEQVPFPGDDAAFQLNWLAKAPFMQTRVGSDIYEDEAPGDAQGAPKGAYLLPNTNSTIAANDSFSDVSQLTLKALTLHVNLSDQTYVSGLYNQRTSLKIEVFFNGTLAACLAMPNYDGKSGSKDHHQVFAGTRVDFLAERPWIILPPGVAADGNTAKNNTPPSVEQRWQHIGQALQAEARERGTDEQGNIPPTADFLHALATTQMPEQVYTMQRPGGKTFGVIDVVITSGEGRKLTSGVGYLKTPKRMIDESYPFVLGADGSTMQLRVDAPSKSESDAEPQDTVEPTSEVIDVDAEGDSDPEYRSHTKRQALRSGVQSKQDMSPVLPSALTMEPLTLSSPPLAGVGSSIPALIAPNITDARITSSPVRRSADTSNIPRAPETGRAHTHDAVRISEAELTSRAGFTPKMMNPDLTPNSQTTHMLPSPYTFQFSDPTLGGVAPSDLMRQIPGDNAGLTSSPLDRFPTAFQGPGYQYASPFPTHLPGLRQAPSSHRPHAGSLPGEPRGGLPESQYTRRDYTMSGMGPNFCGAPESYKPNMLPQVANLHGYQESRPPHLSFPPFDRRLSLPLPPAGLYSVPTKPKRSVSPKKASPPKQSMKTNSNIVVRRLVVYGQDRSIIVDHRWEPELRLDLASNRPVQNPTRQDIVPGDDEQKRSIDSEKASTEFRGSRKSTVRMGTPPPTSPLEHAKTDLPLAIDNPQETSAFQPNVVFKQPASPVKNSILTGERLEVEEVKLHGDQLDADSSNQSIHATESRLSRRTTSSNNILGVQGPKANPFWFEDPEEILHEASARLRRSRSFAKPRNTPDAAPSSKIAIPVVQNSKIWDTATSSPLSSLHTTPEPDMEPISYTRSPQAPIRSSPASIPQADGSSERKSLRGSRRGNETPSPVKLTSTLTTPQLARHEPSTPQSSATKKRKNLHRTLPKEPRSPTRLKTNSNPSLNRDCVIAYAESKDKKNKQGILRQVKSERQGVFSENDVVFAARFFVEE